MEKTFLGIILSVLISCDVSFGLYYTIVGPNSARVNSPYQAYLASTAYDQPENLKVSLQCGGDEQFLDPIELYDAGNKLLEFTIPNDDSLESCTMYAKLSDRWEFKKELKILKKNFSILIETDRSKYTIGDEVKYRVVVLDAELKPYKFESLSVVLNDGVTKKIHENIKIAPSEFYAGSFKIPDDAKHGVWKLAICINGNKNQMKRHKFTVAEYNLPKFQVKVETSANVLFASGKISARIRAEKILGNGKVLLSGPATITATVIGVDDGIAIGQEKMKRIQIRGGNSEVTFDFQRDLRINQNFPDSIVELDVVFEDSMTKRTESASINLKVHMKESFIIENNLRNEFITPGEPYTFEVSVKKFDGSVEANGGKVDIQLYNVFYSNCLKKTLRRTAIQNTTETLFNGIATYDFTVPKSSNGMNVRVIYKDTKTFFKLWRVPTKTRENIRVEIQTEKLSINQNVDVQVKATHPIEEVHALVVGRTGILYDEKFKVVDDSVALNFQFTALPSMAPTSSLIVFYIQTSGEIIFDLAPLEFNSLLPNFLNISLSATTSSPGSEIIFDIEAAANSFVALSAIDQRSLLLGSSSQISISNLKVEVDSFYSKELKRNFTGKQNAYTLLDKANAFILTDAHKGTPVCISEKSSVDSENDGEDYDGHDQEKELNVPFVQTNNEANYETWIFETIQTDSTGRTIFTKKLPDTFTSYIISGFSLSQQDGLGIAGTTTLGSSKKFFVEVDVPKTLLVGEVLKVSAYVYNLKNNPMNNQITVELKPNEYFELVDATETGGVCKFSKASQNSKTAARSTDVVSVAHFFVKSLKKGLLKLEVIAKLNGAVDQTFKTISVSERTLEHGKNVVKFFDLREFRYDSYYFEPEIDGNAEPGSMQSEVFIDRNPMGPALLNVNDLIKNLPKMSTEQKLSTYMPAALFIRYLMAVDGFNEKNGVNNARKILEDGYRYVVSQKITEGRKNGAFRNWNGDENTEIIEVTARVLKFLSVAKDWMETEEQHILDALNFLKQNAKQGKFMELNADGKPTPSDAINDVGLTALVATAFLENTHYVGRYEVLVNKALDYIEQSFDEIKGDSYTLAISAYALAFRKTDAAERFLAELQATSVTTAREQHWEIGNHSRLQKSKMVETAAYVILAYEKLDQSIKSVQALNWLQTQRNHAGGTYSTKDTVIAMQALSTMAKHYHANKFNMVLNFTGDFKQNVIIKSDKFNFEQPPETFIIQSQDGVSVNAEGEGVAYVQIHKTYLLKTQSSVDTYNITVKASGNENQINLRVCVEPFEEQPQTLVEVSLPSGFEFEDPSRDQIISSGAKYVNTRNGRNVVDIFFNKMARAQTCFGIKASTFFSVGTQLPYSVKVYDYNDKDRFSAEYYLSTSGAKCPK